MSIDEGILDILKQKLLPEIQDMQAWRAEMRAEFTVINGRNRRLDHSDKRFEQVDKRLDGLHEELRELRSYAFRQQFEQNSYPSRKRAAAV